MTDETRPSGDMDVIGENMNDGSIFVRAARTNIDYDGLLLWGGLPWTQFYYGDANYFIDIKLKKVSATGNPLLFKIVVQLQENNVQPIPEGYHKRPPIIPDETDLPLSNIYLEQDVYWNDITHATGVYDWFRSNSFQISEGRNLQFYIFWYNQSDIYIDQVAIYNEKYRDAFITNTLNIQNEIITPLTSEYLNSVTAIDYRFADFYFDEPFMLTARARGKLQNTLPTVFTSRTDIQVNGATGNVPEYFQHFDHKYARESENAPHKNYILFNMYPFGENSPYDQTTVQNRLNDLIKCSSFGGSHEAYSYNYAGLLPSQIAAQQYDDDSGNDLPLFMTLQVHAEHELDSNGNYVQNLTRGKRPPTKDEIFAMGNLSLAYGVKGFMYYMVPTRSEERANGKRWGTYGLFDQNEPPNYPKYNYATKAGTWQNPALEQDTNERYTAVREFITSLKPMETTLLRLKWLEAKYWDETGSDPYPWVKSVQTSINANFTNPDNDEMVQTGYFEEYSHLTGYNQSAKYIYIVNRRCNTQGSDNSNRYIRLTIDSTVASNYTNIKVTNLKTGQTFFTSKNSIFTLFLNAGDGTLLKFEPTILAGGLLIENETVSSSIEVDSSLELSQYKKLRIENGADVTFKNSSRLYVYNSALEIEGTTTNPCVINFISPNWTLGNGLIARYADVTIENVRIEHASCGIYGYRSRFFEIYNTIIDSCYFGISIDEQNSIANFHYLSNVSINNCSPRGISTEDVRFLGNDISISGGETGIWFSGSEFNADFPIEIANISISNTVTGVYSNNSHLFLGKENNGNIVGGYNTFLNADNIIAENYSDVYAQYDFWTSKSNSADITSFIIDEPSFKYGQDNPLKIKSEESPIKKYNSFGDSSTPKQKYELAKRFYLNGQLKQARMLCGEVIDNDSENEIVPATFNLLLRTFRDNLPSELENYLNSGNNAKPGSIAKGLVELAFAKLTEDVLPIYEQVIEKYPGKFPCEYSLYKKALFQVGPMMDKKGAKITHTKLRTLFPSSLYLKDLDIRIADSLSLSNNSVVPQGLSKQVTQPTNTVEYDYNLYNNYPNPFNPETVIAYSLKEKSNVTLTVYNIAGQKVAELISGEMEKGMYEQRFNGTKFSSGVYIFRLTAQSLEHGNLSYTKTIKALLLK